MSIKEEQRERQQEFEESSKGEAAKIERIAAHTAGLVEDLKSWFELKIEFALLDFKEEIKATGVQFAYQAGSIAVLLIAALFGLTALSFGLGEWLGHPGWGFLVVTGFLVIVAFVVKWVGGRAKRTKEKVKSYSYRVNDAQQSDAQLNEGASKKRAARKLKPKDSNQLMTPGPKTNNHGKDQ